MTKTLLISFLFSINLFAVAQITTIPSKPLSNENVTVVFDAGKGNKALFGYTSAVYVHLGLITSNSHSTSDWKYVFGEWGKAAEELEMTPIGGDKYSYTLNIRELFEVEEDVEIHQLAMVFRDENGEIVAKTENETDFLIPIDGFVKEKEKTDEFKYTQRSFVKIERTGPVLALETTQGMYHFQFFSDQIVKTKFIPNGKTVADTSISVILFPSTQYPVLVENDEFIIWKNKDLNVRIEKEPLSVSYHFKGQLLFKEELGFVEKEQSIGLRTYLEEKEAIYGTGERAIPLNRRGYRLELFNKPDYNYGLNAKNLNYSVPVILSSRNYLLFIDNPQKGYLDIGASEQNIFEFGAIGGEMRYYVVAGKDFNDLQKEFTSLVGRQPLPPRWALGNLQSRMAYRTQYELDSIVDAMLQKKFPLDAVIIDFYWFGNNIKGYLGQLDWYRKNWPDPESMIKRFKEKGVKTVLITEPFVIDSSYWFVHGDTADLFAKNKKGETYIMKDFYFGHAALMDMFKPATKEWFWQQYDKQIKIGVAGWWGDLGEPETHPEDMIHVNGKAFEVHNMYAHEWAKMLYEGYKENYPERRLFHLNRSGATGTQRYSIFPWSGDVSRSWSGLQAQLPLMLNMSLCGLGYISSDLGGFALGKKDEELYIRWLQMGVFNPIFRPHGSGIPSEPIFFSEQTQSIVRKAIKLRYRLMPYIYNLAFRNSLEGEPLVKPLIYYHPKEKFEDYSDSYYFGNQLLVSPVIEKGQTQKKINLPNGLWYDFYTDTVYEGGKQIIYNCDLSYIPVLVKAGAFIPMLFDYQTTDSYPDSLITMHYYPSDLGSESVYELFEDDGAYSKSVDNGEFSITNFYSQNNENEIIVEYETTFSGYKKNESRKISFVVHHIKEHPKSILLNGQTISFKTEGEIKDTDFVYYSYEPSKDELKIDMEWVFDRKNTIIIYK
jgi:oligosaccharide 4-alpha-D-glucosyltransferase